MIKLPSFSLFTRLYLTVSLAVIISATLSFFIIEKMKTQTAVDEYVFFTDHLYHILLDEEKVVLNSEVSQFDEEVHHFEDFLMSWQIRLSPPPYEGITLLGNTDEVIVYFNDQDQYISVYKLPNVDAWLLITENNLYSFDEPEDFEHEHPLEEGFFRKYTFDEIAEVSLLLIVMLSAIAAIYWPIRIFQRQLEKLIDVQRQFGVGDMHVRADKQFTKPLDELANSFNSMAGSIANTVNENQIFAQAVPHEVRTPLSRIQLAVGLLKKNNNDQQQIELLNNIDNYIDDMGDLINQVVALSKLNLVESRAGIPKLQKVALAEFVEARVDALDCKKKLKVICDLDKTLEVEVNPAYLRLLVDNLLKNAAIYGREELIITLSKHNGLIELSVQDDGVGIPKEYLKTIFTPFFRVDLSRNRKTGGLGLGLAISKAASKKMHCQLSVENTPSKGAKFTCTFTDTK